MKQLGEWEFAGEKKYTCPSAILSTTNPTWPNLGPNPDLSGKKSATNAIKALHKT
jgi:hypothetical protein